MRILYIHQYFRTPHDGGSIRSYHLAKGLVAAGHEVDMLCAHDSTKRCTTYTEGIRTIYLPVSYNNRFGFFRRVFAFCVFIIESVRFLRKDSRYDLAYVSSTPLTVGIIALWLKKYKKVPYIFEVRDLWPEAPIQMGVIKGRIIKSLLYTLEKRIYIHAEKLVALSPGMRNGIEKKVKNKEVHLIPNMSDCEFFTAGRHKDRDQMLRFGINSEFVISYFGAAGKVNHLDYLLDACLEIKKQNLPIKCLIMADGSELDRLKKRVVKEDINIINFYEFGSKHQLREMLEISDATYISFADIHILKTNSPNKFFDSIAAGKLVITNIQGWIKELVEKNRCGIYADPYNPQQLIDKIKFFLHDEELLMKYQKNAREMAETFFNKDIQIEKLLKAIDKAYKGNHNDKSVNLSA